MRSCWGCFTPPVASERSVVGFKRQSESPLSTFALSGVARWHTAAALQRADGQTRDVFYMQRVWQDAFRCFWETESQSVLSRYSNIQTQKIFMFRLTLSGIMFVLSLFNRRVTTGATFPPRSPTENLKQDVLLERRKSTLCPFQIKSRMHKKWNDPSVQHTETNSRRRSCDWHHLTSCFTVLAALLFQRPV